MTEEVQTQEQVQEQPGEEAIETPSVLDTPELKQPARPNDAHRGRIESVVLTDPNDNGNRAIHITLTSIDTGQTDETDIWLPKDFAADINVDPETLPTGEKDPVTGEVIEANQRGSYGMGIANSDKDATLQTLRILAAQVGMVVSPDAKKPTNIEEYVALHGDLLTGLELVYTRTRPSKKRQAENPQFKNVLRINRFLPIEGTVGNPKVLRKYVKAWEELA